MPDRDHVWALGGFLIASCLVMSIAYEHTSQGWLVQLAGLMVIAAIGCFSVGMKASRLTFVIVGLGLLVWSILTRADWLTGAETALQRGGMVIAIFTALVALRGAAMSSSAIIECGRFLAEQKPGRRYLALTLGGHIFGLILLYGSISLLGTLAVQSVARIADPEIRNLRTRRMLVAIQRGFSATICWSPIAFSMVMATTLVPGASWSKAALPALASALMMMAIGWGLDSVFKPKRASSSARPEARTGGWAKHLQPLLALLALIIAGVFILRQLTGVNVIGAVMSIVPLVAITWIFIQHRAADPGAAETPRKRIGRFVFRDLPQYRGEIVLLFMAAFIGSLGSFLLAPLMAKFGPDLASVSPELILVMIVLLIPVAGQLGMNPLLSVSLLTPLLPSPQSLGIDPTAMVVAITGGWALCGTTSPFTASVLLVGSLANIGARRAGLQWNGVHALLMVPALSLWSISLI